MEKDESLTFTKKYLGSISYVYVFRSLLFGMIYDFIIFYYAADFKIDSQEFRKFFNLFY